MTALRELFTNHKLALEACGINATVTNRLVVATKVRDFANLNNVGDFAFDSIETLLGLIEAKCKAEAPLTDEDINAMLWEPEELYDDRASNTRWHNACIDKLHAEIKRMRKEADRG